MKLNTNYKGKDITITLTKEQIIEITSQAGKQYEIKDITSVAIACDILGEDVPVRRSDETDSQWAGRQLELIIRAANLIDNNNKEWVPDFDNQNQYKYIPYARKEKSGWVLVAVLGYHFSSYCSAGFYYKVESTASTIFKANIGLYNQWLG